MVLVLVLVPVPVPGEVLRDIMSVNHIIAVCLPAAVGHREAAVYLPAAVDPREAVILVVVVDRLHQYIQALHPFLK